MGSEADAFAELCAYTLSLGDASFVHQYVICAYGAQNADEDTNPLALTFALVGLYLRVEKNFSGRQIQRAHAKLAERKQDWPVLTLPLERGAVKVEDVLAVEPGISRIRAIEDWCRSVWEAFRDNHGMIADWVRERL